MSLGNATVLFALLLGALVWAAEIMPPNQATQIAVATNKEEPLPVIEPSKCASETWPNITTDCLRNVVPDRRLADARPIVAVRQ